MRVSIYPTDPGFANFRGFGRHRVFLNGIEAQDVVTADEELGEVLRLARDEHGSLITDGDELIHEIVRGKVEIVTDEIDSKPRSRD